MRKSFTWFFSLTLLLGLWCITSASYAQDCNLTIDQNDVSLVTDLSTVCDGEDLVYQVDNFTPGDYQFAFNYDGTSSGGFTDNNQLTTPEGSTFTVTVKEVESGCISNTITVTAEDVKPLILGDPDGQDALCNGENGEITINWSGAVGPYHFYVASTANWSAAQSNPTPYEVSTWQVGRPAGTYYVAVNSEASCLDLSDPSNWKSITLTEPNAIVASAVVDNNVTCNGGDDGQVTVSISSGGTPSSTGNYLVTLDGMPDSASTSTPAVFDVLKAGDYVATVSDANGCWVTTDTVTVTEPVPISFDVAIADVDCSGAGNGAITVSNITGGSANYTVELTDYNTGAVVQTITGVGNLGSATFSNLDPIRYGVTITDASSCSTEYENPNGSGNVISVQSPSPIDYSVSITDVKCKGDDTGKISISNVTGGSGSYLYSFNGGAYYSTSTDTTGLVAGTYIISVKNLDGSGCDQDSSVVVAEPDAALTASATNIKPPTCPGGNDGHFTIVPAGGSGGESFSVDGSAFYTNPIINEQEGVHQVTVKDAHDCTFSFNVTIPTLDANVIDASVTTPITCNGENQARITPTVTTWAGTGRTVKFWYSADSASVYTSGSPLSDTTELYAGTYYIGATDQYGCYFDADKDGTPDVKKVTVDEPKSLEILNVEVTENATCFDDPDGIVKITAFGGTNYTKYWMSTQDIDVSLIDPNDFSDMVDVMGSDSSTVSAQTLKGTYYVYVKDDGCSVVKWPDPITVKGYDAVMIDDSDPSITDVLCYGDSTGAITLPAATGGSGAENLTYTLQMDDEGWMDVDGATDMTAPEFSELPAGDYRVIVADSEGCAGDTTVSIPVTQPDFPVTFTSTPKDISCNGSKDGMIAVQIKGGTKPYKVQISNQGWLQLGDTVTVKKVVVYTAGTYNVHVMDASGCMADADTVTIGEPDAIMVDMTASFDEAACPNDDAGMIQVDTITGGNTAVYDVYLVNSDGDTIKTETGVNKILSSTWSGLATGDYTVIASDGKCDGSASGSIVSPNKIVFDAAEMDSVLCVGDNSGSIAVSGVDGGTEDGSSYDHYTAQLQTVGGSAWVDSTVVDGAATFGELLAGDYAVRIMDGNGCTTDADTITVTEPAEELALNAKWKRDVGCTEPGQFVLTATGGNGDYTFYWAPTDPNTGHVLLDDMPSADTQWTAAGANDSLVVNVDAAATYIVWVKDANGMGCVVGGEVDDLGAPVNAWRVKILNDVPPIAFDVAHTNLKCFEDASGTITVSNITGGESADYKVFIDGVAIEDTVATELSADTITVQVKDMVGGCTTDSVVVLTQPEELTVSLDKVDGSFTCPDATEGWLEATAEGGSGAYSYQLYQNGSPYGSVVSEPSFFVPIGADYSVKVMDDNCDATSNIITIQQVAPTESTIKDVTCYGAEHASAEIMATGEPGRTFEVRYRVVTGVASGIETYGAYSDWMPFSGDTIVDGLSYANEFQADAGYFYFETRDSEGCLGDTTKMTFVPVQHPLQTSYETTADGLGATLTITGGISPYSYQVDTNAVVNLAEDEDMFQVVNLQSPASIVTVTDAHGCSVSDTISVDAIMMTADPAMGDSMAQSFDVTLTFNREVTVAEGDITGGTVTAGTGTEFTVSMSGNDGDTLSLMVGNAIMDASGNTFAGDTLTYVVGDNTAPMAQTYSPESGSTLTDNHPTLTVTFDEDVVFNQAGSVYITPVGSTTPKLTIPVTADMVSGNTLTVTYTYDPEIGGLNKNKEYSVTFDGDIIADAAGNSNPGLSDNSVWTFTTGDFATGVKDPVSALVFKVYPNPFDGYVTVDHAEKLSRIIITNVAGQRVKDIVSPTETIHTNDLRSGVYFMTLITKDDVVAKTERIVKR
ncbi:MAG TPA: Ig-like domain-containing protein [Sunxiuqinia sp.]|nr:Ig-like domain-containing protein [Sunxiuqinia sp.]